MQAILTEVVLFEHRTLKSSFLGLLTVLLQRYCLVLPLITQPLKAGKPVKDSSMLSMPILPVEKTKTHWES